MNLGCHAAMAAVKAATNSDSVELDAVIVCALLLWAIALSENANTHPPIDLCF